jgi:hypothetical protein
MHRLSWRFGRGPDIFRPASVPVRPAEPNRRAVYRLCLLKTGSDGYRKPLGHCRSGAGAAYGHGSGRGERDRLTICNSICACFRECSQGQRSGGADAAIRQLYSHHSKALHSYGEHFCPDGASSDDIVQETFILVQTFYRGGTLATVARELGIPHGTAGSRLHYALHALRQQSQDHDAIAC